MTEKLKKKPRMTCKQCCPVWNDIDKDCEIYGEHHFTPRTCPHYNIEILEKKMMIERFNKFIEENYDTQNTKNEQQKDLCITSEQLTEQWKKGELPSGEYYIKTNKEVIIESYFNDYQAWNWEDSKDVLEVLAPVPSYEEWQKIFHYASKYEFEYTSCAMDYENLKEENAQLKELLKECKGLFNRSTVDGEEPNNEELIMILTKIDEVLK